MFWRYGGYGNISTLDSLLEKADLTLEELLDESDLIQELKQNHTKLILYLSEPKVLEKLLEYVVAPKLEAVREAAVESEPKVREWAYFKTVCQKSDEDVKNKQRNRYAYVSAEILSSDNRFICEALLENQNLLRKFWDFLKLPPPLDPLQASYFTKVNEALLGKKTEEMLELFKDFDGAVNNMLRHVDSPMIMDLLLKIISLDKAEGGKGIVDWLHRQDIIPCLLSFLSPEHSGATQTSAGDFLKAIITISANTSQNQQSCVGPNELTRQLVSQPCIEKLISYMLQGGNPLTVGVGIVIEVIRKNNSDYDPYISTEVCTPTSGDPIYLGTLLRLFALKVPEFMALMLCPTIGSEKGPVSIRRKELKTGFGKSIEPLGFDRFKICELMAELLHCSNMGLLNDSESENLVKRRDLERERLKAEGKLGMSTEDLPMKLFRTDEVKKLQVHNASDDDGFERVSHSDDDEVYEYKNLHHPSSLEKNEECLDKSSSPILRTDEPLEPEMTVLPLSPTKEIAKDINHQGFDDKQEEPKLETKKDPLTLKDNSKTFFGGNLVEASPEFHDETATTENNSKDSVVIAFSRDPHVTEGGLPQTHQAENLPVDLLQAHLGITDHPEDKPAPLSMKKTCVSDGELTQTCLLPEDPLTETDTIMEDAGSCNSKVVNIGVSAVDFPTVGDFLKIQFVEHKVVPTILVFNGTMERGFNRSLAFDLFESGDITMKIVNGQKKSDELSMMRLGYMGHLTLIAEEVVKFTERHPPQTLPDSVLRKVMDGEWILYVEVTLTETRERDNAILGGFRPVKPVGQRQAVANTDDNFGCAIVQAGLNEIGSSDDDGEMARAEVGFSVPLAPNLDKFDDEEVDYEYFEKLDRETPLFPGGVVHD